MNATTDFQELAKQYKELEVERRQLQGLSSEIQRLSKQAIFAFHREDSRRAHALLRDVRRCVLQGRKRISSKPRLACEGMWRAALEEYAEALCVRQVLARESIDSSLELIEDPEIWIGGLCDGVGEMVRMVVKQATAGDVERVEELYQIAQELVEWITTLDLTGSLRTKGDQARQHLRRLEEIRYDLSLRRA